MGQGGDFVRLDKYARLVSFSQKISPMQNRCELGQVCKEAITDADVLNWGVRSIDETSTAIRRDMPPCWPRQEQLVLSGIEHVAYSLAWDRVSGDPARVTLSKPLQRDERSTQGEGLG